MRCIAQFSGTAPQRLPSCAICPLSPPVLLKPDFHSAAGQDLASTPASRGSNRWGLFRVLFGAGGEGQGGDIRWAQGQGGAPWGGDGWAGGAGL
jgi:hypothetical protein